METENDVERNEVFDLLNDTPEPEEKNVALIYDGKQYSIRIPREFASVMELNKEKHQFKFVLIRPSVTDKEGRVQLRGEIVGKTEQD